MSIKRHSLYNLGGALAPLALMLVTVPLYLGVLGEARYGVLAIIWLLTGYFGVFDFGLGRATAFAMAQADADDGARQSQVFRTSLLLNTGFGLVGAAILFLLIELLFSRVFAVPPELAAELQPVLPWLCLLVPLLTLEAVFTGALIGKQQFLALNIRGVLATALTQLAPLAAVWWIAPRLDIAIFATIGARALGTALIAALALRAVPAQTADSLRDQSLGRQLLGYGGWISLGRGLNQLVASFDRFLIAAMLGPVSVTHYAVPFQLVSRGSVVPNALAGAIFPRLAGMSDEASRAMALRAIRANAAVMGVLCCVGIIILPPFLALWIGEEFASLAALVGQLIGLSVWLNAMALVPHSLIEAQGRPRETLMVIVMQAVPFILLAWLGISWLGIIGVALARNARSVMDLALLAGKSGLLRDVMRIVPLPLGLLTGTIAASLLITQSHAAQFAAQAAMLIALAWHGHHLFPEGRRLLWDALARISPSLVADRGARDADPT